MSGGNVILTDHRRRAACVGKEEGRGWRKNARAARPRGPGHEPGTYRVLGEGQ